MILKILYFKKFIDIFYILFQERLIYRFFCIHWMHKCFHCNLKWRYSRIIFAVDRNLSKSIALIAFTSFLFLRSIPTIRQTSERSCCKGAVLELKDRRTASLIQNRLRLPFCRLVFLFHYALNLFYDVTDLIVYRIISVNFLPTIWIHIVPL